MGLCAGLNGQTDGRLSERGTIERIGHLIPTPDRDRRRKSIDRSFLRSAGGDVGGEGGSEAARGGHG